MLFDGLREGGTGCRDVLAESETERRPEILSLLMYGPRLASPPLRTCFDRRDGKVDADLLLRDVDGDGGLRGAGRHVHLHADHVAEDGHLAGAERVRWAQPAERAVRVRSGAKR